MCYYEDLKRELRTMIECEPFDPDNFDMGSFAVKDGVPMVEVIPELEHRCHTTNEKTTFTLMSTQALVASLNSKYKKGAENLTSVELSFFQKTQIEETFVIGETDTKFYKNGSRHIFNNLRYIPFEDESGEVCVDNLLVCKILKNMGTYTTYKQFIPRIHKPIPQFAKLDGLYRIREVSIYKLMHDYDMSTTKLRQLVEDLDYRDVYISSDVMRAHLDRFRRLITKICDTLDSHCKQHDNYITIKNPISGVVTDTITVSGKTLDDFIEYSVKELSKEYSSVDTNEALTEITFIPMEEVESGVSYFMDTYQIGDSVNGEVYVKDSIQIIHKHKDLDVTVFSTKHTQYYTPFCGLPHKITTIRSDIDRAIICIKQGNQLMRYTINEDEFEEYGIFSSFAKCQNHNMSKVTTEILKGKLDKKELDVRAKKLELSIKHAEYMSRINIFKELIKLTKERDKNALLVEKLKYEKAVAESELTNLQVMEKQYNLGKSMIGDAIRLAT